VRIAALALGVLAGLVASLILALGGMDAAALRSLDGRQMQLVSFGLYVIANFGMLGAGVALAAPLAGAILLIIGAFAWLIAGLVLHHGPDFVLLTPPGLLVAATAFAVIAWLRRGQPLPPMRARAPRYDDEEEDDPRQSQLRRPADDEEVDDHDPARMPVGAGFFGQGGTATPARVEAGRPPQPALHGGLDERDSLRQARSEDWRPGSRRPPPRQRGAFRPADEDDDDEESGWGRVFRGASSVLSFGLYAALAGAAVLVVLNLRQGDIPRPAAAAKIDAPTSVAAAPVLSSSAPPATPVLAASSSSEPPKSPMLLAPAGSITDAPQLPKPSEEPQQQATLTTPKPDDTAFDGVVIAPDPTAPPLVTNRLTPQGGLQPSAEPQADVASAEFPEISTATAPQPMPFEMPAAIAAGRKPSPRRSAASAPTAPRAGADTGI
jgi:hypothetical protein